MKPTVAVVGASSDRRKFGNKAVRAYLRAGYDVFPVHPSETTVEGLTTYKTVAEIPVDRLDRIAVYLPPLVALKALESFTTKPTGAVYLNPGVDDPAVVARAKELGLNAITGCAIIAAGVRPDMFPDA